MVLSTGIPVDNVIATQDMLALASRTPNFEAEADALKELGKTLCSSPETIVQKLVDKALSLTNAGSAGLSLFDVQDDERIFRWKATAGELARYHNGTMPRDFSPCGEVCRRQQALVMRDLDRAYPYVSAVHAPFCEALLVPFYKDGAPIGTIWVVHHNHEDHFTAEDMRVLEGLTQFAGMAAQMSVLVSDLQHQNTRQQENLEENKAEAELAKIASHRKDEFLAALGHELRNPLQPIKISLQLLKQTTDENDRVRPLVDRIDRQARQIEAISNGLMDSTALRLGKVSLRVVPMTLQSLVAASIDQVSPVLTERKHTLAVSLPDETIGMNGDEDRLLQALSNVLLNAAKYTPPGGQISIKGAEDRHADTIVIDVQDSGIGLGELDPQTIFEMFAQVGDAAAMRRGGLGIGLAVVKQIIDQHAGTITAHSEGKDQGSLFQIRLPRQGPALLQPQSHQ